MARASLETLERSLTGIHDFSSAVNRPVALRYKVPMSFGQNRTPSESPRYLAEGLRHGHEIGVASRILGVGVMGGMTPLEVERWTQEHEPADRADDAVEPAGAKRRAVGALVHRGEQQDEHEPVDQHRQHGEYRD